MRRDVVRAGGLLLLATWLVLSLRTDVDRVTLAWLAVFGAAFAVARARPIVTAKALELLRKPSSRAFVFGCAAAAALLSYLVVSGPMRDRPFSPDAAVYLFQARALSHFHFGMPIPEPHAWFGGRFLFEGNDGRLYGVFPPGYPLFLVPFVWLSVPLLAGPVAAALLAGAQWLLGRAIEGEDGVATRVALLVSLPSFARAIETADLLSHALVAILGAVALSLALLMMEKATWARALGIGAALGWAFAARLLDGVVLAVIVGAVLVFAIAKRRVPIAMLGAVIAGAAPFVLLLAAEQVAATGSLRVPTQSLYFARSDWPATCHRLGFGVDVGCAVEHGNERAALGADGYQLGDAFRLTRLRANVLGMDLFGLGYVALLGFYGVFARGVRRDALLAGMVVVFTCAYGLFYYGNAPAFGARHLFPIAPALLVLVARAAERIEGALVAVVLIAPVAAVPRWVAGAETVRATQGGKVDIRAVMDRGAFDRGLFVTGDELSWIAAFDSWRDGDGRIVVRFDGSGLKDVRRVHPDLTAHSILEGDRIQSNKLAAPPPGVQFEIERAWPSFVRPSGDIGVKVVRSQSCCNFDTSGERFLFAFAAKAGSAVSVPFFVATAGRYALRVDGLVAPDYGTWAIAIDGAPLDTYEGFAEKVAPHKGNETVRDLSRGDHVLTLTCTGKRPESSNYLGGFDVLVGAPAP